MGLPIHAPAELEKLDYDRIVICSMYQDEIQDQLNLQLNIPFENIDILDPDIRNQEIWISRKPRDGMALGDIYNLRKKRFIEIHQPLILITQIQRSGGTLLSQLFDSHPSCYVHPHEIYWGKPDKWNWPTLALKPVDCRKIFDELYEMPEDTFIKQGYAKTSTGTSRADNLYPFVFDRQLQFTIFCDYFNNRKEPFSQRDVLNAYMTSYFNAWLDCQNFYSKDKQFVVGFIPRVNMYPESISGFLQDYNNGFIITIIRHPYSWYASARMHDPKTYTSIDIAIDLWKKSTFASLSIKRDRPQNVILLTFENLIKSTRETMQRVCMQINLPYHTTLEQPTFNSMPIRADSSFAVKRHGILRTATDREHLLSETEIEMINSTEALSMYEQSKKLSLNV